MCEIVLENQKMKLVLGENGIVQSLFCKESRTEYRMADKRIPVFSVMLERPFNNEIKLAYPNKRTIFQADRIRMDGNRIICGFELVPFEAVIEVTEAPLYIAWKLADFIVHPDGYAGLHMSPPPVFSFRLLQIPVPDMEYFGDWLNVIWDGHTAVNVLSLSPFAVSDCERREGYKILYADALRDYQLKGCSAALICSGTDTFLDAVEAVENDYNLPKGVAGRRNPALNRSAYWHGNVTPENVDEHIKYAKKFGFTHMLLYYTCFYKYDGYWYLGDCIYREEYKNGISDIKRMLDKIKAEGIVPGLHILQTHIGLKSHYVRGKADARLNLRQRFTLSEKAEADSDVIFVEQNPQGCVTDELCRVLKFDGELIHYEGYSETPPYRFYGCDRGYLDTEATVHMKGTMGGILDISEFGAMSCYIDQNTSLQDEVSEKLAELYNAGFEFIYFDGSEGTNPPFEIEIPRGQYSVYSKLKEAPLYAEGAAKSHFNWHWLTGANAFDIFPTEIFKKMIVRYPLREAYQMQQNFTRVNFGWWKYYPDSQPDIFEFGTSKAAAFDCPVTIQMDLGAVRSNPRTEDNMEVMYRWEQVRTENMLTDKQKEELKCPDREFILLLNEKNEYELVGYRAAETSEKDIAAYFFERNKRSYMVYWNKTGNGKLKIHCPFDFTLEKELGCPLTVTEQKGDNFVIPAAGRLYFSTYADISALKQVFLTAEMIH